MNKRRKTGKSRSGRARPSSRRATAPRPAKAVARQGASAKHPARAAARKAGKARHPAKRAALAADCTIAQSASLKSRLAKVVGAPGPVTVDLSGVRRIDTAGFQVLAAFIRERHAAGRAVQCEGASESFSVTATLLGLGALFSPVTDDRLQAEAGRA